MDAYHAAEQVVNVFDNLFQLVPSAGTNGLAISLIPSCGHTKVTAVPLHTVNPTLRFLSVNVIGSSGSARGNPSNGVVRLELYFAVRRVVVSAVRRRAPRKYSVASSNTRFSIWSYPLSTPSTSLPPASFTRTAWSMHALISMAVSFFADMTPRARLRDLPMRSSPLVQCRLGGGTLPINSFFSDEEADPSWRTSAAVHARRMDAQGVETKRGSGRSTTRPCRFRATSKDGCRTSHVDGKVEWKPSQCKVRRLGAFHGSKGVASMRMESHPCYPLHSQPWERNCRTHAARNGRGRWSIRATTQARMKAGVAWTSHPSFHANLTDVDAR